MKWGVVVPAGGTVSGELAEAMGGEVKALARFGDKESVLWVLDAVEGAGFGCEEVVVVGGLGVGSVVNGRCRFVAELGRQMQNARAGVEALGLDVDAVLFLPSDAPLLTANGIRGFVDSVSARAAGDIWFSAGICPLGEWERVFPGWANPSLKLKEGRFVSGAYYATSRRAFFMGLDLFEQMSASRKSQFKMLMKIGLTAMARYGLGLIGIDEGEVRLGKVFGGQGIVVSDCDAAGMADFDSAEDLVWMRRLIEDTVAD